MRQPFERHAKTQCTKRCSTFAKLPSGRFNCRVLNPGTIVYPVLDGSVKFLSIFAIKY